MHIDDTKLDRLMKFNKVTIERMKTLPCMMHSNICAIKSIHEMHLSNKYRHKFKDVAGAFLKKYQNEN